MNENFEYLFKYLAKENISIDKNEFEFQIQSHPDYPSLLSIADTLSFLNIDNGVIRAELSDLELLPDYFVALLKEKMNSSKLYFIEKKGTAYYYTENTKAKAITKSELESRWEGIVLLAEKHINDEGFKPAKRSSFLLLPILTLLLLVFVLTSLETVLSSKLFLIFPAVGLLFSIAALKDLFGTKNELLNDFCNITASTSCVTVVSSSKWKIFEIVNFSDLSMVFFGSQFLGLLIFMLSGSSESYFTIQKILLLAAFPVLFASVYYQKYVEKKWCPVCLTIISIIILELSYLLVFHKATFSITLPSILLYGLVFISVLMVWLGLKKLLTSQKELKEFQIKSSRFMSNYEIFKNTLLASEHIDINPLSTGNLVVGNNNASLKITIVTNPFCGHCKLTHKIAHSLLEKHFNTIQIKIIIKVDLKSQNDEIKLFYRSLMAIYLENSEKQFVEALNYWFENKNISNWLQRYQYKNINITKIDSMYYTLNNWCEQNEITYTPAIFINGYEYPNVYDRENLEFFVNELIEDTDF